MNTAPGNERGKFSSWRQEDHQLSRDLESNSSVISIDDGEERSRGRGEGAGGDIRQNCTVPYCTVQYYTALLVVLGLRHPRLSCVPYCLYSIPYISRKSRRRDTWLTLGVTRSTCFPEELTDVVLTARRTLQHGRLNTTNEQESIVQSP